MLNTLYVEGATDQMFFCAFRKRFFPEPSKLPFAFDVKISEVKGSGIFQQINKSATLLSNQSGVRLAFVCDADQNYQDTYQKVLGLFKELPYGLVHVVEEGLPDNAIIFKSNDYDAVLGVWIMPENQQNGALESFIKQSIASDNLLLDKAVEVVKNVEPKLFDDNYQEKAELFTWMAWQKEPTRSYGEVVAYLDANAMPVKHLIAWLKNTFDTKTEKSS